MPAAIGSWVQFASGSVRGRAPFGIGLGVWGLGWAVSLLNCWFLGGNNGQRVGQLANERAADKECGQKKKRRNERKLKAVMLGERGRAGGEAVKKWQRMSRYSRGSVREVHNSFSMHSANAKNFPNKWHRSGRIISLPAWLRLGCLCLTAHLTSVSQTLCLFFMLPLLLLLLLLFPLLRFVL